MKLFRKSKTFYKKSVFGLDFEIPKQKLYFVS